MRGIIVGDASEGGKKERAYNAPDTDDGDEEDDAVVDAVSVLVGAADLVGGVGAVGAAIAARQS